MGTKSGIFQLDDFSGGLVTKGSVIKLDPKMTPKCTNVYSTVFGTLRKRLGYVKLNSGATSATCRGLFTFIKSSTSKFLMGKFGTGLYKMDTGVTGWDGTWDSVTLDSTLTENDNMFFDVFKKGGAQTLIFTTDERTDLMQSWSGTGNTAVIAGAPKCKYIKVWMNHVWAANCEAFLVLSDGETPWTTSNTPQDSLSVFAGETAFNEQTITHVTNTTDATDYKEGTYATKTLILNDTFATGIVGTKAITSVNLSAYAYVTMWIKSSIALDASDLQFLMDDTASCASPIETINLPALAANTWTQIQVALAAAGSDTAIISIGLKVAVDKNQAFNIWTDDIRVTNRQYISMSVDHGDIKVGHYSLSTAITSATFTTGIVSVTSLTSPLDLSSYTSIDFWIKSTDATGAGDLRILLDDTTDCSNATTKENISVPALTANVWTYISVALANPTSDTAIRSVGLKVQTDQDAVFTIKLSNVRTTFTEPDRITRSAVLQYDDWNGADSGYEDIFTAQDAGLTGMQELKASLYVFKRKSVHRITYLGGRPLLKVEQVKSTIGTISPRTLTNVDVPAQGEYTIFLGSDRQLYLFDGYNSAPISESIQTDNGESVVFMNNINCTTGLDAAMDMCHAVNLPDYHWYVLFAPIGATATGPTHAIIYDYLAKAFWTFDNQPFTASWLGDNGIGTDTPFTGGLNYCWTWHGATTYSDDSAAITAFADGTGGYVTVTSAAHGLSNGDVVVIAGTTSYNGKFTVSSVATDTFKILDTWVANDATGTWACAIAASWESMKLSGSKQGRPMLKKARYIEGNGKVNSTYELTLSFRNDWASTYTACTTVVQSNNVWVRDISQCDNLVQVKVSDQTNTAPFEVFSLDFVGEDLTVGR